MHLRRLVVALLAAGAHSVTNVAQLTARRQHLVYFLLEEHSVWLF